ncbi:MAG: KH domain-containing protein [Verrucomicrobiota bacterium]
MRYFVEFVVSALADKPDMVSIEEEENEQLRQYKINVSPGDIGRIIGRKGKTINAMRSILNAVSEDNRRIVLEVK